MAQQTMTQDLSDLASIETLALVAAQSGSGSPEPGCFFGPEDFYARLFREMPSLSAYPFDQIRESATGSLRKTKRPFPDSSLAARARRALLNEGFPGKPYVA